MTIKTFVVNPLGENCYVVNDDTKEAVIIDCGCSDEYEWADIKKYIANNDLQVKHLLNTHLHFDHIWGNTFVHRDMGLCPEANYEDLHIYENMDELNEFLTDNNLYMTLDVGHANHVGYSADDMIFDCIKHVHMHDNFGDDDAHLPLGEGSIDLKRVVNNLESKKYDGIYILEVNDYDSIKKSNEYMKENF